MASLRQQKEEFVSGHGGTSTTEVLAVVLVLPSARLASACRATPLPMSFKRGACCGTFPRTTRCIISRGHMRMQQHARCASTLLKEHGASTNMTALVHAVTWLLSLQGAPGAALEGVVLFAPVLAAMVDGQRTAIAFITASVLLWCCCAALRFFSQRQGRATGSPPSNSLRGALQDARSAGHRALRATCAPPQRCVLVVQPVPDTLGPVREPRARLRSCA